jgi:hypothetical protein
MIVHSKHELFQGSVIPYLERNRRQSAPSNKHAQLSYRAGGAGRALVSSYRRKSLLDVVPSGMLKSSSVMTGLAALVVDLPTHALRAPLPLLLVLFNPKESNEQSCRTCRRRFVEVRV